LLKNKRPTKTFGGSLPKLGKSYSLPDYGKGSKKLGLILGLLTGVAAFFGAFMNLNFLMAGTVSVNPALGIMALGVVLAWKVAGYIGIDRWLLPMLGTPWRPGSVFHGK
jgi:thiosulfate dehydrogenase [quinone] large subunit